MIQSRRSVVAVSRAVCLSWAIGYGASANLDAAEPIAVQSAVVTVIDNVAVAVSEPGLLRTVEIRPGQQVRRGERLGSLDDREARLKLQHLAAELELARLEAADELAVLLAKKALAVAASELLRAEESNQKYRDAVSESELDKLRFTRDQAELQVQHAEREREFARMRVELKRTQLDLAQLAVDQRLVLAPLDGLVTQVDRQPGEWMTPGERFCRIVRLDRLRVEGFVRLADGGIAVGQAVQLRGPGSESDALVQAVLTFIDPEINPITGQYRVWAEFDNGEQPLRPGHRPETWILPSAADPAAASTP